MKTIAKLLAVVCLASVMLMAGGHKGGGSVAAVSALPNPLGFITPVGVPQENTVDVYNTGNVDVTFTQFQIGPDFQIVSNACTATLPVGQRCAITIVFNPNVVGTVGEYLYMYGNLAGGYPYPLALTGKGE